MESNVINVEKILNAYKLGEACTITEINQGQTSHAMLIEQTNGRKYILRELKNIEQAVSEYQITSVLAPFCISSQIRLATNELPYFSWQDKIYNLQTYIEHQPEWNKEIDFIRLGKVVSIFHTQLQSQKLEEQADRFALKDIWEKACSKGYNLAEQEVEQLAVQVEECLAYDHQSTCYIHGDLGKWNLLFDENSLYIIDFGEVRRGDHHFDLAAVLTSTIDANESEGYMLEKISLFEEGYRHSSLPVCRKELLENIQLWMIRGLVAVINEHGLNQRTLAFVEKNLNIIAKFKACLTK